MALCLGACVPGCMRACGCGCGCACLHLPGCGLWLRLPLGAWAAHGCHPCPNPGSPFPPTCPSCPPLAPGMREEYDRALRWVASDFDPPSKDFEASVFETVIRVVGGFLAAYDVTGDAVLLDRWAWGGQEGGRRPAYLVPHGDAELLGRVHGKGRQRRVCVPGRWGTRRLQGGAGGY